MLEKDESKTFNHATAELSDQITCVGDIEHIYMHACKSASVLPEEKAIFYLTIADMVKDFRRDFMREHFPDVAEEDWCLLKATDSLRQRIYESCASSHEDLKRVNEVWSTMMEHIFGVDLSGCSACREDRKGEEGAEEQKEK